MSTKPLIINTRMYVDEDSEKKLNLAIQHDFAVYGNRPNGMEKESLYEWVRWLINRRIQEIMEGKL